MSLILAFAAFASSAHADHFVWKSLVLTTHAEVLHEALILESSVEIAEFRAMLAGRGHDPDAYLGSLISMLPTDAERDAFATRFDIEDPVYGTPAQMRALAPRFKAVLMHLSMRRMPAEELKIVRARGLAPSPVELATFELLLRWARSPGTAAEFFEVWDSINVHCEKWLVLALGAPPA